MRLFSSTMLLPAVAIWFRHAAQVASEAIRLPSARMDVPRRSHFASAMSCSIVRRVASAADMPSASPCAVGAPAAEPPKARASAVGPPGMTRPSGSRPAWRWKMRMPAVRSGLNLAFH